MESAQGYGAGAGYEGERARGARSEGERARGARSGGPLPLPLLFLDVDFTDRGQCCP